MLSEEYFMRIALGEAQEALSKDEVPVGCVIVRNNIIIAKAYNLTERLNDVTAHAEMQAITSASSFLGGKYLSDCTMYVTLEPCVMCAGAISWARISKLVISTRDEHRGFIKSGITLHPKTKIVHGILESECSIILKDFFKSKR